MPFQAARPLRRRTAGFTLVELLGVLLIVGILGAVAALSLVRQIAQTQALGFADALAQDINQARSTAMARGRTSRITFVSASQYSLTLLPRPSVAGDPAVTLLSRQNARVTLSGVTVGDRLECSSLGFCVGLTANSARRAIPAITVSANGQQRILDITALGLTRIRQ